MNLWERLSLRNLLVAVPGFLCLILTLFLLFRPYEITLAPPANLEISQVSTPNPVTNTENFQMIGDRPLLSSTRRPPPPPPPVVAPAPPPPLPQIQAQSFLLLGVFVDEEQRLALLQTPMAPRPLKYAVGQEIAGWKIEKIDGDHVIFVSGDVRQQISFPKAQANGLVVTSPTRKVQP